MSAIGEVVSKFLASEEGQTLIASVLGLVSVYAVRLLSAMRSKNAADESKTKMNVAIDKAMNMVELIAPRIWKKLAPELQKDLLDGRIDAEEMKRIEAIVLEELTSLMTADGIKDTAKALGYEVPGFVAWVASKVLSFIGVAHDPTDPSVPNAVATVHLALTTDKEPVAPAPQPDFGG